MKINTRQEKSKLDLYNKAKESEYKVIGEYINSYTKIKLICPNNHEWEVTPQHFRQGVRCPRCQNKSPEKAKETFYKMVKKEGYICFDEYKGNKIKVQLKCPNDHIYSVRPNDFMTGHRCRSCSISNSKKPIKTKSLNDLKEIADKRGFEILGEYVNIDINIRMKCPNGHIHEYNIYHFKEGFGCPKCSGLCPEEAKNELIEMAHSEGYEVMGNYINNNTKITFKCPNGHVYKTKPNCFKNGTRCPMCNNQSHGENAVIRILKNKNIVFEVQKTFDNLIGLGGGKLRFDIYIPQNNVAIEIQGEQHYEDVDYFASSPKEHDKIKRKYCNEHNIKLYEIKYSPKKLGRRKAVEQVKKNILLIINTLSV